MSVPFGRTPPRVYLIQNQDGKLARLWSGIQSAPDEGRNQGFAKLRQTATVLATKEKRGARRLL
ncbi:hypothetical protein GCM10011316_16890 [Roseibium aquae]|uniref:Uncharacterized protein n=1 Tax=Roseibium aquae TaxID=1323746 RepID=A0A916X145_9HYPH|nr:hypothetical protein GCM10011316_16890 [Roseibium aquae]